jgi:hypothetical protein
VLGDAAVGQRHPLPAAGVEADRRQQHERHGAQYCAPSNDCACW